MARFRRVKFKNFRNERLKCLGFNSTWNDGLPRNASLYTVFKYFVEKVYIY
jgi:hypothetical protein